MVGYYHRRRSTAPQTDCPCDSAGSGSLFDRRFGEVPVGLPGGLVDPEELPPAFAGEVAIVVGLPDYLPAMVEFCWLTLPDRDDDVRDEFVGGMLSLLPGMREAFEAADTPYRDLIAALKRLLERDLALSTEGDAVELRNWDDTEMIDTIDIDVPGEADGGKAHGTDTVGTGGDR